MDLNIKGVIHLNFRKFKNAEELIEFVENDDNFDTLANVFIDKRNDKVIDYSYFFNKCDEIWVINNYLVCRKDKGSDEMKINPDFSRFLLEKSFDYVELYNKEKKKEFTSNLNIDSILDRINEVGIENISEEEKEFLKNNG